MQKHRVLELGEDQQESPRNDLIETVVSVAE